jgi:type II secretory pathway component PulF
MPIFRYKAKNKNAETVFGKVEAACKEDAVEKITKFELIPVSVESQEKAESGSLSKRRAARFGHVRQKELYVFSRQFASLLKAGIPILRALQVLSQQTRNVYFQTIIQQIYEDVKGGKSFSDSIAAYPSIFPLIYVNMSRAGEEGGKIQDVIAKVADYLWAQMDIRSKVATALAYPIMMLICGIGAAVFILTSVMPKITRVFLDTRQALPGPTTAVIWLSNFLIQYWMWLALAILVVIFLTKQWIKTKPGEVFFYTLMLKTPWLGDVWIKEDLARFSRTMALLIESGVSIVTAMNLSIPTVFNIFVREQLSQCRDGMLAGRSFGEQIKQMSLIPDVMGDLIAVGEEAGSLAPSLTDVADNYEQEINDYIKIVTTLFEPLMIVIVGSLIGFIVIAMLMPIFQMDIFAR